MEIPLVQYHATTLAAAERIGREGLKLPAGDQVATYRYTIPTISTTDDPQSACAYHPNGALVVLMVQGDVRYLNRTTRHIRKDETWEAAVNRWIKEAKKARATGVYVGPGLQSTIGNQTLDPRALEIVNIVRCRGGRASLDGSPRWEIGPGDIYLDPPAGGHPGDLTVAVEDKGAFTAYYGTRSELADWMANQGWELAEEIAKIPGKGRVAYLAQLDVEEPHCGKGVGSTLVRKGLRVLAEEGVVHVFAHAAPQGGLVNIERLLGFYERLGFEVVDCCPRDLWPVAYRKAT